MKYIGTFIGLLALSCAGSVAAQATTQQAELGPSGDPVYSVRVQGENDVIYKCKPETSRRADGTVIRECVRDDDDAAGPVFASGDGIGNAGPAIAGLVVALAVAAGGGGGSDSDTDTTTGTADDDG